MATRPANMGDNAVTSLPWSAISADLNLTGAYLGRQWASVQPSVPNIRELEAALHRGWPHCPFNICDVMRRRMEAVSSKKTTI